jgi:hypothetical protein
MKNLLDFTAQKMLIHYKEALIDGHHADHNIYTY